jgi:hypothetical protein
LILDTEESGDEASGDKSQPETVAPIDEPKADEEAETPQKPDITESIEIIEVEAETVPDTDTDAADINMDDTLEEVLVEEMVSNNASIVPMTEPESESEAEEEPEVDDDLGVQAITDNPIAPEPNNENEESCENSLEASENCTTENNSSIPVDNNEDEAVVPQQVKQTSHCPLRHILQI